MYHDVPTAIAGFDRRRVAAGAAPVQPTEPTPGTFVVTLYYLASEAVARRDLRTARAAPAHVLQFYMTWRPTVVAACRLALILFPGPDRMRVTMPVDMEGRKNKTGPVKDIRRAVPEGPKPPALHPARVMGAFSGAVLLEAQRSGVLLPVSV